MPVLSLRGVNVDFPFTPYPCQTDYMNKVIECLQSKVNGVLESPTGTGKTLCLLCATLGWREYFKDSISARKISEKMGGAELFPDRPMSSWGTAATDGDVPAYYTDIPKIIYASRTHSQLTQVVSELKNTAYRPKVCVLGSREQLCINQEIMKQESNHIKVHMCRAKVSTRSCLFYNNVDGMNCLLLVCPYYLSRSLKQHADLIFMPYNYLLDPKSRRAHNIELKGAVVIFDEAHNVEKMCEESTSFDLTPYDLTSAIDAVDKLLREQASDIGKGDSSEDFNVESLNSEILMDLELTINSFEMPSNNQGITKPGSYIYELFEKTHVNFDTKTAIVEAMEQITGYLAGKPGIFLNTSGLQKVADIIQVGLFRHHVLFSCLMCSSLVEGETSAFFQVHIHPDTSNFKKKQSTDVWASSSAKKQGNVLSYWCFCPGFSMQELLRQEVRCIILTSGTLSPLSSFTCEMQIPFPVSLENPHVIQKDQIFVSIVDKGPDGVQLSTAFDKRWFSFLYFSLFFVAVNLSRVVPHGLLVFFPSYPVLDKTLEFWRPYMNGIVEALQFFCYIRTIIHNCSLCLFFQVIDGFYDKVNDPKSNGGSFFAVCRGKASEGLDFADTYGRGVIITGLPFPPRMDPRVVLKMQYLDEMCRNKSSGMKYLSGQEWYRQQASRAVNQAIGRVIRHREDYGAIFLCDHRFKNTDVRAQLPSWVRPYVRMDNFGTVVRDAAQFFRVAQKLVSNILALSLIDGTAGLCIQYEMEMSSTKKKPLSLLDALDNSDPRSGEGDDMVGEERKPVESSAAGKGKAFMVELKRHLSQDSFTKIMHALQVYKATDHLDDLVAKAADLLLQDPNTHSLLRGLYQFIRPHHKKQFDEKCQVLTGQGCAKKTCKTDVNRWLLLLFFFFTVKAETTEKATIKELDSSKQLNQGGSHLGTHNLCGGMYPKSVLSFATHALWKDGQFSATLLSDIKKAIGSEKTNQLFIALQTYKKTNNYEQMVSTVVGLLTERDEDIVLLRRLSVFIPPHHSQQFSEMLKSLTGSASVTCEESEEASSHPVPGRIQGLHLTYITA
uniref:Regulator of telomere elongation helicase 1 n=1 Tax=Astyanax mexicanus TaxID=7994 RepID=A0A8B9HHP4_ASTMX